MTWPAILGLLAAAPIGWGSAWTAGRLGGGARISGLARTLVILADLGVAVAAATIAPGGWALPVTLALGWSLVLLSAVDLVALRLPDVLTLPVGLAGLAVAPLLIRTSRWDHLIGGAVGYGALAGLSWLYARLRGRDGLGLGDAKLTACAGAWLGWAALPSLIVLASGAGLAWVAVGALRGRKLDPTARLAFGPALCLALWVLWLLALSQGPPSP